MTAAGAGAPRRRDRAPRAEAPALRAGLAIAWIAAALAAAPAWAQPEPDAGTAAPDDGGVPDDGGAGGAPLDDGGVAALGPDASTRILIDGPTLLGMSRPQVSAAAAPSEVRLGDKLTLFVEVTYDDRVTVALSAGLDLAPVFDELKRSSVDARQSDGTHKRIYQVLLQVWEVGDLRIPPIQVSYSVGGDSSWVVTNEVPIRVIGVIDSIDDPNAFLGATPPIELRRRDWRWIIGGAAILVMAVGGLLAWWIARRRRRRAALAAREAQGTAEAIERVDADAAQLPALATSAPAPRVEAAVAPPRLFVLTHEQRRLLGEAARRALDALDALERAGTLRTDQPEGYRKMVAIVTTFAVEQFLLPPRHRTTGELLRGLARTSIRPAALGSATRWFSACDLVKFAAERVADDGAAGLAAARALILEVAAPEMAAARAAAAEPAAAAPAAPGTERR